MKVHFKEEFKNAHYELCETDVFPEKGNVTCVFALLQFEGKIYLTKNRRGWELPGGHIEKGEDFDQALQREMQEEAGTRVKNKRLFGYKKYTNYEKVPNRDGGFYPFPHSYILIYIAESTGEDVKIDCPDTLDYGLFSIEEALEKIDSKGTRKILEIMKDYL